MQIAEWLYLTSTSIYINLRCREIEKSVQCVLIRILNEKIITMMCLIRCDLTSSRKKKGNELRAGQTRWCGPSLTSFA